MNRVSSKGEGNLWLSCLIKKMSLFAVIFSLLMTFFISSAAAQLEILNDIVTFKPDPSTFQFTSDTKGCSAGSIGKFEFNATLTNKSDRMLSNLMVGVKELTNGNLLLTSEGLIWQGDRFEVPNNDDYVDGILSPNEKVNVSFTVCIQKRKPFRLLVNALRFEIPSEEEVNEILSINEEASYALEAWSQEYGIDQAQERLVEFLSNQTEIQDAGISEDGETIWIIYKNGLDGAIMANPPDTWGYPSSNKGVVFSPVSNLAEGELVHVYNRLNNDTWVEPDPIRRDGEVSVNFLKDISSYGVISLATHGGVDRHKNVIFQSGEKATTLDGIPTSHLADWIKGRIIIGNNNLWLIRPSFIRHYAMGNRYPGSIIFLSMCHSLDNKTLSNAFIDSGAKTVFGWRHSVNVSFARQTKEKLLVQMIDNGKTTGEAHNNVPKIDPYTSPNAILLMAGDDDMKLPVSVVTIIIPTTDKGWYSDNGIHDANIENYFVGTNFAGDHRNFFVFDLRTIPHFDLSEVSLEAYLEVFNPVDGFASPQGFERYALFNVTTSIEKLTTAHPAAGAESNIYIDLGTGTSYGIHHATPDDNDSIIRIPLFHTIFDDITTEIGTGNNNGLFAIGGAIETIEGTSWPPKEFLFGYSHTYPGDPANWARLIIIITWL